MTTYARKRLNDGAGSDYLDNIQIDRGAGNTLIQTQCLVAPDGTPLAYLGQAQPTASWMRTAHDLAVDICAGDVAGYSSLTRVGRNPSINSYSETELWYANNVTPYVGWLQSAATFKVKTTMAMQDYATGNGARKVMVQFINGSWNVDTEEITLGASAGDYSSASSKSALRFLNAWVTDVGTYGSANTGDISIMDSGVSPTLTYCAIPTSRGQSAMGFYTVPAGYKAFIKRFHIYAEVGTNKVVTVRLYQRANADDVSSPFTGRRMIVEVPNLAGIYPGDLDVPLGPFAAKTDLWWTGYTTTSGTAASARMDIVLEAV